ncbi:hypothetical protein [Streptomyces sp. NPDC059743]|uniref:hypothetical protein n=1 Tax=Streptomyces sp. NPDC059743 TaxID=3346928 RepID=UPI00364BD1C1
MAENRVRETVLATAANLTAEGIPYRSVGYRDGSTWAEGCNGKHSQQACLQADLDHYLPRTTRKATPTGTAWDPVLKHLREHPQDPAGVRLTTVLTTPLMVGLARTIYGDTPDRDPSALLDTGRFSTSEALEDHLLDEFIPTVYRDWPLAQRERVPHWHGYLAQHLDRLGTRDLAWWQLGDTMRRSSRMCVIGLVAGLGFGLVYGLIYGNGAREPSRVRVQLLGGTKETHKETD